MIIDNLKIIEPGHQIRLRENMVHGENFVILPKFAFKSLSKWYGCNRVIELTVHEFKLSEFATR